MDTSHGGAPTGQWRGGAVPNGVTGVTTFPDGTKRDAAGNILYPDGTKLRPLQQAPSGPGAAVADAQAVTKGLLDQYNNPTTRPAPTVSGAVAQPVTPAVAAQVGPAAQAGGVQVGPAASMAPTTVGTASQTALPRDVTAPTVGLAQGGPASTYQASHIAVAPGATASLATPAQLEKQKQDQIRERQMELLTRLEAEAAGTAGPSAAQALFQKNTDQAIATQRGLAAGAHGTGRMAAQLSGNRNIGSITGTAAADSAILRATEQQKARDALLSGLESTRGADVNVATSDAQLRNAAELQNAQSQTSVSISNADRENARNMKQADLEQAAAAGNAAAKNELNIRNAELHQQQLLEQSREQLSAAQGNQSTATTIGVANTAAQNRMRELQAQITSQEGIATAAQQNEMARLQATLDSSTSQFNAGQTNDVNKLGATLSNATNLANLGEAGATSRAQLSADIQRNIAQMDSDLRARGLDDAQRKAQLDAMIASQGQGLDAATRLELGRIAWETAKLQQPSTLDKILGFAGNVIGGVGPAVVGKLSDKRQKTNIRPLLDHYAGGGGGGGNEIDDLLAKLHPYSFEYKNPDLPGAGHGRQTGVMAQDLEKSAAGRQMVIEEGGMKRIDPTQAVGTLLAAMTVMNAKIKAMKGARS